VEAPSTRLDAEQLTDTPLTLAAPLVVVTVTAWLTVWLPT
jgi:hypothetical protein